MELNRAELRRARRQAAAAEKAGARAHDDLLERALAEDGASSTRADGLLGGITRRRFFTIAGFSAATAAVLAACGEKAGTSTNVPQAGLSPVTTAFPQRVVTDVVLLRTAASLEYNLIDVYTQFLTMVSDQSVKDALTLFRDHHQAHATSAENAARHAGGVGFSMKNPVVDTNIVQPALKLIKDGGNQLADIVAFSYAFESVATETYQSFVPILTTPALRSAAMVVGGSEARHAAVLGILIENAAPVAPLQSGITTGVTTTTVAGTTTTLKGGNPPDVFQVPGAFQPLTTVSVGLNKTTINADLLGPNSYMYG